MKRAIVVYDSGFGNTEKIARALARGMEKRGVEVDCFRVDEVEVDKLVEYDLLAIGGPTHMLGMSRSIDRFGVRRFALECTAALLVVVFVRPPEDHDMTEVIELFHGRSEPFQDFENDTFLVPSDISDWKHLENFSSGLVFHSNHVFHM